MRRAIWWLRQASGDAAYENYLRCVGRTATSGAFPPRRPLSRQEFYLDSVRRRFSSVSRCC
ncbi:MAG: CstA-like transporter-associated (seleno)protein [Candidatus Acidiferrales bacterium]